MPALVNPQKWPTASSTLVSHQDKTADHTPPDAVVPITGCPIGHELLHKFHACIKALPRDVGIADDTHPLAAFSGDPTGCIDEDEDAWEKFDGPLNMLLQKPSDELQHLVHIGEKGLIGLCHLLEYLVTDHQVSGVLFEGKLRWLMDTIDKV